MLWVLLAVVAAAVLGSVVVAAWVVYQWKATLDRWPETVRVTFPELMELGVK